MIEKKIKLFKRFLKEEGVYKAYAKNFSPLKKLIIGYSLDASSKKRFLETCGISHALYLAFDWEKSDQRFDFWYEIYCKWIKIGYEEDATNVTVVRDKRIL